MTTLTADTPSALRQCANCESATVAKFCANCGEKQPDHHDLKFSHFLHELTHEILHVDSKLFTTLRLLFTKPGQLTVDYFGGRRSRAIGPLRLFLVMFALQFVIYALSDRTSVFRIENVEKMKPEVTGTLELIAAKKHITVEKVREGMNEKWGHTFKLIELLQIVIAGAFIHLLYRQRHFVEHLVFCAHFLALSSAAGILVYPLRYYYGLWGTPVATVVSWGTGFVLVGYLAFAMKRYYERGAKLPWVRALVGYGLMMLAIGAVQVTTVAYVIASILRH